MKCLFKCIEMNVRSWLPDYGYHGTYKLKYRKMIAICIRVQSRPCKNNEARTTEVRSIAEWNSLHTNGGVRLLMHGKLFLATKFTNALHSYLFLIPTKCDKNWKSPTIIMYFCKTKLWYLKHWNFEHMTENKRLLTKRECILFTF